ncbi:hypothetical protein AVEN_245196-1 [Araneus ventricosus]|uniref:Helitron helicase-like domain-containing protein n=1 Tax=Araneus ventricosus TaxID=182803 RepID=A0A4Y2IKY9_ARAVE|nr:hypothetical protein AVEN_245196-1 [Araneus ventricosus]
MVRKFGRPDLFVTFTYNPTWVDILNVLEGQQRPEDRPDIVEKSHIVVQLAVHLTDQQAIVYQDEQEEEAVARRQTTLTAWFELNKNDRDSHNYLYTDIPHYYTFNKNAMKWEKRKRGGEQVIGRMPVVNIQNSERYYLRLLLLRKLGAVSFNDLKTVDGIECNTFQQACKMHGLLEGDQHWYDTLNEAIQTRAPFQLRLLFAMICGILKIVDLNLHLQKLKSFLSISI